MSTDTTMEKIVIKLSNAPSVRIVATDWPTIASVGWHNGEPAPTARTIEVREHADGRRIVHGTCDTEDEEVLGFRHMFSGYLLPLGDDTVAAIRRVADAIGDGALGAECIGRLPAQDI